MGKLFSLLKISIIKKEETNFFIDVIERTLRERKHNPSLRKNDLIDMMVEAIKGDTDQVRSKYIFYTLISNFNYCLLSQSESNEQYEQDSKIRMDKSKKSQIDETTIIATAMLMLVAGNFANLYM